jgi:phenylpyruvate tautomerase PptA (4-oxalocrotonate tautomerase family)
MLVPARMADSSKASCAGSRDLTEAMVAIEGENMRPVTWVLVEELKSGNWGIAGSPLTTNDVKALAAGRPVG